MAREVQKLTSAQVDAITEPGKYLDGDGLWLQVSESGTKSWLFRFTLLGRTREHGLGPLNRVTLAEARKTVKKLRVDLQSGIDPIKRKEEIRVERARSTPFSEEAEDYIKNYRSTWTNPKTERQWRASLKRYAYPVIGNTPVSEVDTSMVIKILEPIWSTKTETANRVRNRIELILARAKTGNRRTGENPATWLRHLDTVFPEPGQVRRVKHHPALHYDKMPDFMSELRHQHGEGARALAFTILCTVRTGDTIGMRWREVDFAIGVWTVPEERGKTRELRIPLTRPALAILEAIHTPSSKPDDFVFFRRPGKPLSNAAMLSLLKRMGYRGVKGVPTVATTHGFRSTFRDWVGDKTDFPREVAEMALAHAIGDQTEEAYRRSDAFEKRRLAMIAWANYCCGTYAADGELGQLVAPRKVRDRRRNANGRVIAERPSALKCRPPKFSPEQLANPPKPDRPFKIGRGLAHLLGIEDAERVQRNNRSDTTPSK